MSKPRKPLVWPYLNQRAFDIAMHEMRTRMLDYLITGRGRRRSAASYLVDVYKHSAALKGNAANSEVRVAMVRALLPAMRSAFSGVPGHKLFLVTLVPEEFVWPRRPGERIHLPDLKKLASECLGERDYIGIIEPGLYDNWLFQFNRNMSRHFISWHLHALVLSPPMDGLFTDIHNCMAQHKSLIPGWPAYHVKEIPMDTLEQRLLYILKLPRTHTSVYKAKLKEGEEEKARKYHQTKRPILPKDMLMLGSLLSAYTITDLTVAGGIGMNLLREACISARAMMSQNEIL